MFSRGCGPGHQASLRIRLTAGSVSVHDCPLAERDVYQRTTQLWERRRWRARSCGMTSLWDVKTAAPTVAVERVNGHAAVRFIPDVPSATESTAPAPSIDGAALLDQTADFLRCYVAFPSAEAGDAVARRTKRGVAVGAARRLAPRDG